MWCGVVWCGWLPWSCYQAFVVVVATGLAPEIVRFYGRNDPVIDPGAKHSFLRPETMESLFVLYRVTGDPIYREWGKRIFENIDKHARVDGGFASIRNVDVQRMWLTVCVYVCVCVCMCVYVCVCVCICAPRQGSPV